ncbi:MAG: cation:proton antiporter [Saprospiraceae bacterium]|nr:cation:proton antiporter [Saprospiraceae bacterium]
MPYFLTLASGLDLSDPYVMIISASLVIVLSYLYNRVANKTNIPSVLLLIVTGILCKLGLERMGATDYDWMPSLEILGIIGLIMIVLEAALDLELTREKLPMIGKGLLVSLFSLIASSMLIAVLIQFFIPMNYMTALLYATPLSILSSAIIIPSVTGLILPKREFMVYDGAFSDILGIMMFYFIISMLESGGAAATLQFGGSLLITIVVSVLASYGLVYVFKDMKGHIRLFLLIAILLILYSAGKLFHLSPLLIILIFGMSLSNHKVAFKIFRNYFSKEKEDPIEKIVKEFHLITMETAFVVRTFFFVVFGMTIDLSALIDLNVFTISALIIVILYLVRLVFLRGIVGREILPELWIAPRGLITILLFFAIPQDYVVASFSSGILLYVIIVTSLVMTFALILDKKRTSTEVADS